MDARQIFGNVFKLLGGVLIVVGLIQAGSTLWFMRSARTTTGTVVDYERVEDAAPPFIGGDAGVLYYPVVTFDPDSGPRVRFTAPSGRNSRVYEVQASVPVFYDADNPDNSRLGSFWGLWGSTAVFAGLGGVFVLVGFLAPHGFRGGRDQNPFA